MVRSLNILGVTGSIGTSVADVVRLQPERFDVRLVTAHSNVEALEKVAVDLEADCFATTDLVAEIEAIGRVDITVAAITGMAGLEPLMAAIKTSKMVAIANKEPLVAAGKQVLEAAEAAGCVILPLDSEHNAIFQVFDEAQRAAVERVIITGSGGPFREASVEKMAAATREEALTHPNWSMGPKNTIDSATLMNKALEIVEACILFQLEPEQVDLVIQPQSVIHGMVEYNDGSVLTQMGASDMRTPIANMLAWPERLNTPGAKLDLSTLTKLDFEAPDGERFPSIGLAYEALGLGQYACVAMNAANEVAVQAFLDGEIGFLDIVKVVEQVMRAADPTEFISVTDVIAYDGAGRSDAIAYIKNHIGLNKE